MISPIQFDSSGGSAVVFGSLQSSGGASPSAAQTSAAGALTGGSDSSLLQTAVSVQSNVDSMLAAFGPELAGDQQLRMMIAMLILQALLGGSEDNTAHKATELAGLASTLDAFGRSGQVAMFSATNIVQIQHQSTLVYSDQAIQSTSDGSLGGEGSPGSRLDVTA